jgi:hypothetical protein
MEDSIEPPLAGGFLLELSCSGRREWLQKFSTQPWKILWKSATVSS